jgi:hypothetical protein
MSILHPRRALVAIAGTMLAIGTGASAASAMTDLNGQAIANTSNPQAQVVGGPTVVQKLADPATPNDDSSSALAALGSPGDPEDDLADALDAMGAAASSGNRSAATSARSLAINILEGNPIADKAYSGMPLLKWNSPAKVKNVPAGGNVVVREVRFGEHALSDTWLLSFDDPNQPYTITFRITEVGTQFGGLLSPSPLLSQGGSPIGGENQALQSLVEPLLATGTTTSSRFVTNGQEFTRAATQDITIAMPPAGMTDAILEPNLQPTKETLFTLERTSADRLNQARADFGFSTTNPSAADKANAIAHIGDGAPEKELWGDLQQLQPSAPGFLDAAALVASGDRQLVSAMRMRSGPPAGVGHDPSADVNVAFLNNEAYMYRGGSALPQGGGALKVSVTNADNFTHQVQALALSNASPLGAVGWGEFKWQPLDLGGSSSLAPGASRTYTLSTPGATFGVWLGDPDSGDQASAICGLPKDGGTDQKSLPCPVAFKDPGDQPAGGHVRVPDQGKAGSHGNTTTTTTVAAKKAACAATRWLQRSGRKAKIGLLRSTRTQVLACFGKPTRAAKSGKQERWRYGSSLTLRFNKGRVISFILRGKKYKGVHNLSAASSVSKLRKALGKNGYDARLKSFRAVIRVIKTSYADIRVHTKSRHGKKTTRIDGKLVSRKSLDRLGRKLSIRR